MTERAGAWPDGYRLITLETASSTNQVALDSIRTGDARDGDVIFTEHQTSGRGRLGRSWESPNGNLFMSLILRVEGPIGIAAQLSFVAAVATRDAIASFSPTGAKSKVTCKWPNDVLINGAKVAGLLNEMSSETDQVHYVVLGIGVNLNMSAEQFPADLRYPATSLAIELGKPVSRLDFIRALLREIDVLYQRYLDIGPESIMTAWSELCELTGKGVSVDCNGQVIEGTMIGLDEDGALLVRTAAGKIESVYAGDVRPA